MKCIYVSLTQDDLASYRVTLDAQGQELTLAEGDDEVRIEVNGTLTRALTVRTARVGP